MSRPFLHHDKLLAAFPATGDVTTAALCAHTGLHVSRISDACWHLLRLKKIVKVRRGIYRLAPLNFAATPVP